MFKNHFCNQILKHQVVNPVLYSIKIHLVTVPLSCQDCYAYVLN